LGEFWFLADWLPYLPDLNLLDFSTSSILQAKGQATPHANFAALRPSVTAEWDRLPAVKNPQDLPLFLPPPLSRH
jgi:hypothetical protein